MSKNNAKRVQIQGMADISPLSDVRDLKKTEDGASFLYGGGISELLAFLSKQKISDLTISEPDLEEIFMHYYLDGGNGK